MSRRRTLGAPNSVHAAEYERYVEMAEATARRAEKAHGCDAMYHAAVELSGSSAIANRESRHAFAQEPFMLKQAEQRLEKLLKRAVRIDEKFTEKCLINRGLGRGR